jgi:tRNA uridine 5-carbamoylmethylation protein Kti12
MPLYFSHSYQPSGQIKIIGFTQEEISKYSTKARPKFPKYVRILERMIKHWEKHVPNFKWEDRLLEILSEYELKIQVKELDKVMIHNGKIKKAKRKEKEDQKQERRWQRIEKNNKK